MTITHQIYLVSDSTGETIDRIFMALKAQFENFKYKVHHFSFTRTENQISKILEDAQKNKDIAKYLNIDYRSTIVVYKNNKEIARNIGITKKEEIYSLIKKGI